VDLLIEGLPRSFDLEKLISSYAKEFSIEVLSNGNNLLKIPHEISPLMIIDLLDGQKIGGSLITVKKVTDSHS